MKTLLALFLAIASPAIAQTGTGQPPKPDQRPATITDAYGNRSGYVQPSGEVRDAYGNRVGFIKPDGKLVDAYGNAKGQVKK